MKKIIVYIALLCLGQTFLHGQERMLIHNNGNVLYESPVLDIDSIKLRNNSSFIHLNDNVLEFPFAGIDSITFTDEPINPNDDIVYIIYDGLSVTIINPFEDEGVMVDNMDADVIVVSTAAKENIEYRLSGSSNIGSLNVTSDRDVVVSFDNLNLTNPSGPAVGILSEIAATVTLIGNSVVSDGAESSGNAAIASAGALIFDGSGSLTLNGFKKHGIASDKSITVKSGIVKISETSSDGFHSEGFVMDGGMLDISAGSDAIDAGKAAIEINGGTITILSTEDDVKGIKSDGDITMNGGIITMEVSGAQSKGVSSKKNFIFNDGLLNITTSGATVLESSGSGFDPSYCTAIKTSGTITVNGGSIDIENTAQNDGGKGFSADGSIFINDGDIRIVTAGDGKTYTDENGQPDSYTSACIKSDEDVVIVKGNIYCYSSGAGGKGINVDGALTIGVLNAADSDLILDVTTTGERFYVSGYGEDADYANPKAAKSEGNLIVNSGTITIACTQNDEGGEGLESKSTLTINGGLIEIKTYDDAINASDHIEITGGKMFFTGTNNDAVDSNGTLTISGGFIIANGGRQPEAGFDCDNSRFSITGGVVIGTGGGTSNPTVNATTQYVVKYTSATAGQDICIKDADGNIILLFSLPTYSGQGGPGPGGGNGMTVLFSDPALSTGSYVLHYGGSISGGTSDHGYNTGGTYSGGQTKNFTISSIITTVN